MNYLMRKLKCKKGIFPALIPMAMAAIKAVAPTVLKVGGQALASSLVNKIGGGGSGGGGSLDQASQQQTQAQKTPIEIQRFSQPLNFSDLIKQAMTMGR